MKLQLPYVPKRFTTQAQVAILGYIILSVAVLLPVNVEKEQYNLTERILSLVMMLLPMIVTVYTINCLVVGSNKGGLPCELLAWLNSGSILIWSILVLVLTLLLYGHSGEEEGYLPNWVGEMSEEEFKNKEKKVLIGFYHYLDHQLDQDLHLHKDLDLHLHKDLNLQP